MRTGEQAFVCPPHLPPHDAWKVNPDTLKKFYAPTDDRGFVLPDATVEEVRSLFEEDYEWPIDPHQQQTRPNVHHFHWIADRYRSHHYQGRSMPARFRELPSVKGVLPRQFHNVIHEVTLPPAMPKYKDMARHVSAYTIARWLLDSAERTVEAHAKFRTVDLIADPEDTIANEILISAFDRQFRGYRMNIERLMGAAGLEYLRLDDPKFHRRKPHEITERLATVVPLRERNYLADFRTVA